jgi:hypothetical protein
VSYSKDKILVFCLVFMIVWISKIFIKGVSVFYELLFSKYFTIMEYNISAIVERIWR